MRPAIRVPLPLANKLYGVAGIAQPFSAITSDKQTLFTSRPSGRAPTRSARPEPDRPGAKPGAAARYPRLENRPVQSEHRRVGRASEPVDVGTPATVPTDQDEMDKLNEVRGARCRADNGFL